MSACYGMATFDSTLDADHATNPANYTLISAGADRRFGTRDDREIRLAGVSYHTGSRTVTLSPARLLPIQGRYQLIVNGMPPLGLLGTNGAFLDGAGDGQAGTDSTTTFGRKALLPPAPLVEDEGPGNRTAATMVPGRLRRPRPLSADPHHLSRGAGIVNPSGSKGNHRV